MSTLVLRDREIAVAGDTVHAVVLSARVSGGDMVLSSEQIEGTTGADHVFDGWRDYEITLRIEIYEEVDGGRERYDDLAVLRAAARARDPADEELPLTYGVIGALPEALGVREAIITSVSEVDDSNDADTLMCTMKLLQLRPDESRVRSANVAAEAETPAPSPAVTTPGGQDEGRLDAVEATIRGGG